MGLWIGRKYSLSNDSLFMVKTKGHEFAMVFVEVKQMDLIKTGKFIAELRKLKGLTQEQLGEQLGVCNKTVSRWETGIYLPPADVLLSMSDLFDVSINELLSGRRLTEVEYRQAAERNLHQTIKESSFSLKDKVDFFKSKWLKEHVAIMVLVGIAILGVFIVGIIFKKSFLCIIAALLLLIAHIWRNNAMMSYVEKNAYDGLGRK